MARPRSRKRGNGEGSIYQRANGRWVACLTVGYGSNGRQRRKYVYGATQKEASDKLDEIKRKLFNGENLFPERQTLSQFLGTWLSDVVKPNASHKTHRTYSDFVSLRIAPALGEVDLRKLDPQRVQHLLNEKLAAGLSATTVKHLRDTLRAALNVAMQWSLIVRNPAAVVRPPRRTKREATVLNKQQAHTFRKALAGHRLEALFMVALAIGTREGEVLGLAVDDFDADAGKLRIRHSLQRVDGKLTLVPTKNDGSYRVVELPAVIVDALKKHLERREEERAAAGSEWIETGRLFPTTRGTMMDPRNLLRTFYQVRDRASVPAIRFHDLRHSAATLLHAMGVPWEAIRQMLGHASVRTTQQFYTHLTSDMAFDAARKIDEFYSG